MSGITNYKGLYLSASSAYTRQIWASGTNPLWGPDSPTMLMGSNEGNQLHGGAGDDTIYVIHVNDRITGGWGVDTAYATVDFTLPGDVENLTLDARWSPVTGIANDGANIVTAVNAGVTLDARGGDDVIVSAGGDTFLFGPGSGDDVIVNFRPGSDVVRLSGYGLDTFAKVKSAMVQVGADTQLTLSASDHILFQNTQASSFSARDFQLPVGSTGMTATFAEEFDGLKLQQQGHADGWSTSYAWDAYPTLSAHTIFGESQVYVDPGFSGAAGQALGLNPFSLSGGVLSINAATTPDWAKGAMWGRDYTSGLLTTANSFAQTYGYFEMRADLPSGQGSFPAFWLLSTDGKYNEIDIMETVNGSNQIWNHVHYHDGASADRTSQGFNTTIPNLSDGFHTFGLMWTPEKLTWYIDGSAVASTATPAALNGPMYMLVNYAVGGSWAGSPDAASLTDMKIDYVRAYSVDGAPVQTQTPAPIQPAPSQPAPSTPATPAAPAGGGATLSIAGAGAEAGEGSGGTGYATFIVNRTGDLTGPSTSHWSVSGAGANPADAADFEGGVLPQGTVYFGGGESAKTIWVPIQGDWTGEANEGFAVTLSSPTGAGLGASQAFGVIVNDDWGGW